jgi:hypothetical protein
MSLAPGVASPARPAQPPVPAAPAPVPVPAPSPVPVAVVRPAAPVALPPGVVPVTVRPGLPASGPGQPAALPVLAVPQPSPVPIPTPIPVPVPIALHPQPGLAPYRLVLGHVFPPAGPPAPVLAQPVQLAPSRPAYNPMSSGGAAARPEGAGAAPADVSALSVALERALELQGGPEVAEDTACVCCFERERDVVLLPCGHVCLCNECVHTVLERHGTCPMCRATVVDRLRVEA